MGTNEETTLFLGNLQSRQLSAVRILPEPFIHKGAGHFPFIIKSEKTKEKEKNKRINAFINLISPKTGKAQKS